MPFDPTVYARVTDHQSEPLLPDSEWIARFVARMVAEGKAGAAADEFLNDLERYANETAASYLQERKGYASPEEAADSDISYWESEE